MKKEQLVAFTNALFNLTRDHFKYDDAAMELKRKVIAMINDVDDGTIQQKCSDYCGLQSDLSFYVSSLLGK